MKVLFLGTCSVGPFYIMNYLCQHGHTVKGCYMGLNDLIMGEPAKPFSPPISLEEVMEFAPDVIGISTDSANFEKTAQIVEILKANMPNVMIGLGGIHPTIRPQQSIEMPLVDFICEGEGELSMLELLTKLENKEDIYTIQSLWFKLKNGQIIKNKIRPWHQNLDDFQMDRLSINYSGVFTGMGCKGRCTFCSTPMLMFEKGEGRYYRKRSVDSILDEIGNIVRSRFKQLIVNLKIRGFKRLKETFAELTEEIAIKDDSFLINKGWLLDFCAKYKKRFWYLPFACLGRADEIDEEIAEALHQAGCRRVVIGFEHGDDEFRNKILFKKCSNEQVYEARRVLSARGIAISGQWIIGFPGETIAQALQTLKLASEVDDQPQIHIAQPYPNTVMYDMAIKEGFIEDGYVPNKGIYADFLFHSGAEKQALRMIYNLFPISHVKIPKNTRMGSRYQDWKDKTIIQNVIRDIEMATERTLDEDKVVEIKKRSMSYRREVNKVADA